MKKLLIASLLILGVVAPGTAIGGTASVKATPLNDWSPYKTSIVKGDKVVWKSETQEPHILKSYKGPSSAPGNWMPSTHLHAGDSAKKRFKKPGKYYFRCTNHSTMVDGECGGMCGLVKVSK